MYTILSIWPGKWDVDADCFYVSCERVWRRALGQAVGVLSNQGACVIAKSYELKAYGIHTCLDFARADRRLIRRLLDESTARTYGGKLNGVAALPLQTTRTATKT